MHGSIQKNCGSLRVARMAQVLRETALREPSAESANTTVDGCHANATVAGCNVSPRHKGMKLDMLLLQLDLIDDLLASGKEELC